MEWLYYQNDLPAVQKLFSLEAPYSAAETDYLFIAAMAEISSWHYQRNQFYRDL